jgi:hypothetical protein
MCVVDVDTCIQGSSGPTQVAPMDVHVASRFAQTAARPRVLSPQTTDVSEQLPAAEHFSSVSCSATKAVWTPLVVSSRWQWPARFGP